MKVHVNLPFHALIVPISLAAAVFDRASRYKKTGRFTCGYDTTRYLFITENRVYTPVLRNAMTPNPVPEG